MKAVLVRLVLLAPLLIGGPVHAINDVESELFMTSAVRQHPGAAAMLCRTVRICHNSKAFAYTSLQVTSALEGLLNQLQLSPAKDYVQVTQLASCVGEQCCCSAPTQIRAALFLQSAGASSKGDSVAARAVLRGFEGVVPGPFSGIDCNEAVRFCSSSKSLAADAVYSFALVKTHAEDCSAEQFAAAYTSTVTDVPAAFEEVEAMFVEQQRLVARHRRTAAAAAIAATLAASCVAVGVAAFGVLVAVKHYAIKRLALSVVQDIAAGLQPDPESVELALGGGGLWLGPRVGQNGLGEAAGAAVVHGGLQREVTQVLDPALLGAEGLGLTGSDVDQVLLDALQGRSSTRCTCGHAAQPISGQARHPTTPSPGQVVSKYTLTFTRAWCRGWRLMLCCCTGGPFPAEEAWAVGSTDLLEHFEETGSWESAARLFMGLRGTPAIALPHVLLLLRRLPGLVVPAELGFRAQLRHQELVRELVEEAVGQHMLAARASLAAAAAAGDADTAQTLQALVSTHQGGMSLRQLCDSLWGLGKAGCEAQARWVGGVVAAALRKSRQAHQQQLLPFFDACTSHAAAFTPSQLSNTLSAVASLQLQPPPSWLAAVLAEFVSGQTAEFATSIVMDGSAGAAADFMRAWYAASEVMLPHTEPQALVNKCGRAPLKATKQNAK
ncbi:hypothetical protein COO60DRAFT_1624792 [Scenedesmus sp. NREL 46B-D3]|nr:hypothetical protein COO60DRAFT_1624792 [Scenedesmus sp. NREL 46B-D3]